MSLDDNGFNHPKSKALGFTRSCRNKYIGQLQKTIKNNNYQQIYTANHKQAYALL